LTGTKLSKLQELIKKKEEINREILNELNIITDYKKEFEKRSKELFGKVKEYYTVKEASILTGKSKSTLYYYRSIGAIRIHKGKIRKEEVYILFAQSY